ncbi:MAG: hypothetical protein ACRDP6_10595 [Actinoallomurus sp.]
MVQLVSHLRKSPIAQWHLRVRGSEGREPERKRVEYYEALHAWLEGRDADATYTEKEARAELDRRTLHSSSSTLYSQLKRRPLAMALPDGPVRAALAEAGVISRLTAETKIWDHWAHRTGWLNGLAATGGGSGRRFAATTLIRVLAVWAAANPALAKAEYCAPPLTAVADLCLVFDEQVVFDDAAALLTKAMEYAIGPLGVSPLAVVDAVFDDLMGLGFEPAHIVHRQLERALEPLHELAFVLQRLPEDLRADVGDRLVPRFEQVLRLVERSERSA